MRTLFENNMDMWQPDMINPPREYRKGVPWNVLSWDGPHIYGYHGQGLEWTLTDENGPDKNAIYMELSINDYNDKSVTVWLYGEPIDSYHSQGEIERNLAKSIKGFNTKFPEDLIKNVVSHASMLMSMTPVS